MTRRPMLGQTLLEVKGGEPVPDNAPADGAVSKIEGE